MAELLPLKNVPINPENLEISTISVVAPYILGSGQGPLSKGRTSTINTGRFWARGYKTFFMLN